MLCKLFSVGLDRVPRIRDKMQVAYKEMTCEACERSIMRQNGI